MKCFAKWLYWLGFYKIKNYYYIHIKIIERLSLRQKSFLNKSLIYCCSSNKTIDKYSTQWYQL